MGKIKSLIHKCFRQVTMNKGNKKVTKNICNYCNSGTVSNATRQKKHFRICVNCPMAVKSNILQMKNLLMVSYIFIYLNIKLLFNAYFEL